MKRTALSLAFTIVTPLAASAQNAAPPAVPPAAVAPAPTPAEASKPAAELAKLQFLIGDWVHEEVYHLDSPGGAKGAARSKNAWILGGHHLYLIYKSNSPRGEFEGRGVVNWDNDAKNYRLFWFDSAGMAQQYSGTFNPEDALVFSGEHKSGSDRVRQQLTIRKEAGGKFLLKDEVATGDGPLKLSLESLAQPAPAPAPAAPSSTAASPATSPVTPAGPATPTTPAPPAPTPK